MRGISLRRDRRPNLRACVRRGRMHGARPTTTTIVVVMLTALYVRHASREWWFRSPCCRVDRLSSRSTMQALYITLLALAAPVAAHRGPERASSALIDSAVATSARPSWVSASWTSVGFQAHQGERLENPRPAQDRQCLAVDGTGAALQSGGRLPASEQPRVLSASGSRRFKPAGSISRQQGVEET